MSTRRALICAPLLPEYDRERGSGRVFELIEFLLEAGWAVSFAAQNGAGGERYVRMLQQRGVATYLGFNAGTEQLIGAGRFDVAILAFWYIAELLMPTIRRLSPATRVVVDTIDLHFLRNARRVFLPPRESEPAGTLDSDYGAEMIREVNAYAAADAILTVSEKEAALAGDLMGDAVSAHAVPLSDDSPPSDVPFAERRGILFVGNFRHQPNVDAVGYLCQEMLPHLDPAVSREHPVYVVGNGLNDTIRRFGADLQNVRMVGWVPSVLPYLQRARVSVVPLRYGAGTKGKLIQTLTVGTPSVSTSAGIEGLDVRHGEHVLVADDAAAFAESTARLIHDGELWQRLASNGRTRIGATHGREPVQAQLLRAISAVLDRAPKPAAHTPAAGTADADPLYEQLVGRIRETVHNAVPPGATVLVASRGDDTLLRFEGGRQGWHFPQDDAGVYAGHYPADSAAAIAHLESLRAKGADFLLFPSTALWWLDHYDAFRRHLEERYRVVFRQDDTCLILALDSPPRSRDSQVAERAEGLLRSP